MPPRRAPLVPSNEADIQLALLSIDSAQIQNSLRTCFNRAYDRQRALCENPALIRSWFELIEKTKAKLGICDEDIYNFDEAGFIMGKITTQLLGNREWVTLIAAISAAGWSVLPFLIFAGQYHLLAWYEEAEIPRD
ncbi:hypothetical protein PtrM4_031950 [Pyrenophora tritici-repentis]|uniref:Uncharacterized protein n=1 Tax=Pyrenophora tritici-repentis TaxID=45151 RepID=A0A834VNL8_9PLEO|nr:hypothetical protein PtrM4_115690 [Pyrenophora tritici-repentis]KAF7578955.1 hypothetical protein PtrM4_031950 [Pyrenophora tritici-repentis]